MRSTTLAIFVLFAACAEGGPATIDLSTGEEIPGILGPAFERGYLRIGERGRVGIDETPVSVSAVALRCAQICEIAPGCLPVGAPDQCTDRCIDSQLERPPACQVPVLDALLCIVKGICVLPVDQQIRGIERFNACAVEVGELASAQATPLPSDEFCEFVDF